MLFNFVAMAFWSSIFSRFSGDASRSQNAAEQYRAIQMNEGTFDLKSLPALEKKIDRNFSRLRAEFQAAAYWRAWNPFVNQILRTRQGFQNNGLTVKLEDGTTINQPGNEIWMMHGDDIEQYICSVWREWNTYSNAVALWRPEQESKLPLLLPLEQVDYDDRLGIEMLRFRVETSGMSSRQLAAIPEQYKRGVIEFDEDSAEDFLVLKTNKIGEGLAIPAMNQIKAQCEAIEKLGQADNVYAEAAKILIYHHIMGHETKSGPWAGSATNFSSAERIQLIRDAFKGKNGMLMFAGNFDHDVVWRAIENKVFDKSKYEGAERWVMLWSFPIGQMLRADGNNSPYMMPLLKKQVHEERRIIAPFLERTISMSLKLKTKIKITWRDDCFILPADYEASIRYGHKIGAISTATFLEHLGLSAEDELLQKQSELKHAEDYQPAVSPGASHGGPSQGGSLDPEDRGGRPTVGSNE